MPNWADNDTASYGGDAVTVFHADNLRQYCWITRDSDSAASLVPSDDLIFDTADYVVGDSVTQDDRSFYLCLALENSRVWVHSSGNAQPPFLDHAKNWHKQV